VTTAAQPGDPAQPTGSAARIGNNGQVIADRLRTAIREGALQPGERLVQEQLAASLSVSRIPLREALHALAAEGLVEVVPQRGMLVTQLAPAAVAELYQLRLLLEPPLAGECVRGCRQRDVEELRGLADRMRALGADATGRASLNYRFHRRIYELADRPLSLRFVDQLLHLAEPHSRQWIRTGRDLARIDAEHAAMVTALAARDPAALAATITAHIEGAREHVLAAAQPDR
jgi:DNA-binding GntR family transcriptional regulator